MARTSLGVFRTISDSSKMMTVFTSLVRDRASQSSDTSFCSALPGVWRYRVSTGTGRPGVSIL